MCFDLELPIIGNSVASKTQCMRFKDTLMPQFKLINQSNISKERVVVVSCCGFDCDKLVWQRKVVKVR